MIIRNFGVRQSRRVLTAPVLRSCLRSLSTQPTTPPTTVADPSSEEASAALAASLAYAKKNAEEAALKEEIAKIPANFRTFKHIQKHTASVGSRYIPEYNADEVLKNPPDTVTLEMLITAQTHMGHNTSLWNPDNARYIYGIREGIHIIDLETTAAYLRRAVKVVEEVAYLGGLILVVGTRKGHKPIVVRAAELVKGCHVFQRWTSGAITNRDQILRAGQIRMVDLNDQDVPGYTEYIQDMRPLAPDLVICLNTNENHVLLYECGLANIPTIGIIDTDGTPSRVTYQIPANDDSLRSVALIAAVLGRAGQRGQERRLKEAGEGRATWDVSPDVRKYVKKQVAQQLETARQADEAGAEANSMPSGPAHDQRKHDVKESLVKLG